MCLRLTLCYRAYLGRWVVFSIHHKNINFTHFYLILHLLNTKSNFKIFLTFGCQRYFCQLVFTLFWPKIVFFYSDTYPESHYSQIWRTNSPLLNLSYWFLFSKHLIKKYFFLSKQQTDHFTNETFPSSDFSSKEFSKMHLSQWRINVFGSFLHYYMS